jgi:thioredoxin 1
MPLSRRTKIGSIIILALLISSAALMGLGPIAMNSFQSSIQPSDIEGSTNILDITDTNLASALSNNSFFVLDFYYPGCGPCKFMNKTISELADKLQGQIAFGRISVEAYGHTATKYKVQSYPTVLFFNDGVLINRIKGNITKSDLLADLKDLKPSLDTSRVQLQAAAASGAPSGSISLTMFGEDKPSKPMPITDENIGSAVKQYPYLVVDASAAWCEWCKIMNVTIGDLASELQGQVAFGLIDMDKNNVTKTNYNITAYPTMLIFKDGKLADKVVGNQQKSNFVATLKQIESKLDTSKVKIVQPTVSAQGPAQPKLTAEQTCANMTKSVKPLLEAFVVSRCPFGLQMQRIMANMISQSKDAENYLMIRYIGAVSNNTITSMHGDEEAKENLRQICIREEQSDKYWNYISCYMKEGKSMDCLKSASIDDGKLSACTNDTIRGLSYAQKDFDEANKSKITGSPTLLIGNKIVSEFDFASNKTNGRSPEALKELLCCAFNTKPGFCYQEFNKTQAITMFEVNPPAAATTTQQPPGKDITLTSLGVKNPSQTMLITDNTISSAESLYPLLVVEAFANWCGFCKMMNVTIDNLSRELQGQVAFGLIDIERNNETKTTYNISAYPVMLIFKDGKLADKVVGNQQKSIFVAKLKQIQPKLDTSKVKVVQPAAQAPPKPKLTSAQVCANMTKSDKPLLEAFVVSRCPFGLQMQRIMANLVNQSKDAENYLKVRYIGSVANNTISSMHGDIEAKENLRQICVREEQSDKYWDYVGCYMKEGKSMDCLKSASIDEGRLDSCTNDTSRGLGYAQKDFDLANKYSITGSPTLLMDNKIVSESDFGTNTTAGRSPEALKELLCCGFKNLPSFCSQELNRSHVPTMFSAK